MNIETHSRFTLSRSRKLGLMRTVALIVCMLPAALPASAETIPALAGVKPMGPAELASHCGGFTLPNGTIVNIGYEISTQVKTFDQQLFTRLSITTGPVGTSSTIPSSVPTLTANIQTVNGKTTITPVTNNAPNPGLPDVQNASIPGQNQNLPGTLPQGIQVAGITIPLNGQTTQVSPADFGKILQGLSIPTSVLNTVNNAIISQNKTLGIDIANAPKFNAAGALGFHNLISQFGAGTHLH